MLAFGPAAVTEAVNDFCKIILYIVCNAFLEEVAACAQCQTITEMLAAGGSITVHIASSTLNGEEQPVTTGRTSYGGLGKAVTSRLNRQ